MDRSPRRRTRLAPAAAVGRWVWSGAWRWVVLTFGVLAVAAGPGGVAGAPAGALAPQGIIDRVCTVVVRWSSGGPVRILALRDELTTREFDDPGRWWPELPDVVGGRDRTAGGTWCATDVGTGITALVLNRPRKRTADPGAASRGVLPLLGVAHGPDWVSHARLDGMASFLLVLAAPDGLTTWDFDGTSLRTTEHVEGTTMVTSGGPEDRKADRHLAAFTAASYPEGWRRLVATDPPQDDPGALVVRHEKAGVVYATVFGELVEARPGDLRIEFSRRPWEGTAWQVLGTGARSCRERGSRCPE